MKIIVSQSGKQYTYELLKGLVQAGHEVTFITLFWFRPQHSFYKILQRFLPQQLSDKLFKSLGKKHDSALIGVNIIHFPFYEILRIIASKFNFLKQDEKSQFHFDSIHDRLCLKKIKKMDYDVFIGYEMSSARSFKEVKKCGKIAVLDLAQIHYEEIEVLANQHQHLKHLKLDTFRLKVNQVKEIEYQLSDYIIVLSSFARDSMIKFGIPDRKLIVANLGFDPSTFKYVPKTIKNFGSDMLSVLFVGSIIKRKGIVELLTAVSNISKETAYRIEVTLIGGLIDQQEVMDFEGAVNFVHFPFKTHDDLKLAYQSADLFVFPSLLDSWAMVVLESMASGTPVIITENTGAKDAVKHHGGGKVIQAGDIAALKKAIVSYLTNPSLIISDSKKAHAGAQDYEWKNYRLKIINFIDGLSTLAN